LVSNRDRLDMRHEQEIYQFLRQSALHEKAITRLKYLSRSRNNRIAELAAVVLQVAARAPYKKGRLQTLANEHPDLLQKLRTLGLIMTPGPTT